jgi:hypothetical protein
MPLLKSTFFTWEIEHGGPFGKEERFAVRLGEQAVQQFFEIFQFARKARRLLIDQERAVGRHAAHQQGLLQPQQVHFGNVRFAGDHRDGPHVGVVQSALFAGGRDADDFAGAGRELLHEGVTISIGLPPDLVRKTPPHAAQHVEDMLARAVFVHPDYK